MQRTSDSFVSHAGTIASYYGFRPLRDIDEKAFRSTVGRATPSFEHVVRMSHQTAAARGNEPMLAYTASNSPAAPLPGSVPTRDAGEFGLHITGVPHALADVIAIKTSMAILDAWGTSTARVRINAFGDRDSRERHARELGIFVRRRFNTPHEKERDEAERRMLMSDPYHLYRSVAVWAEEARREAPQPVHFLSERSRAHFRDLLEHLERIELPYELDDQLCGDEHEPRLTFRLEMDGGDGMVFGCFGGRYDDHSARIAGKRDFPSVRARIFFDKRGVSRATSASAPSTAPRLYFVQLGLRAKLHGLSVIDTLRRAELPVAQSFDSAHLSNQLQSAARLGAPLILIMGEREARDGTVIVRRVSNLSQTAVPIAQLPRYIRTLRV